MVALRAMPRVPSLARVGRGPAPGQPRCRAGCPAGGRGRHVFHHGEAAAGSGVIRAGWPGWPGRCRSGAAWAMPAAGRSEIGPGQAAGGTMPLRQASRPVRARRQGRSGQPDEGPGKGGLPAGGVPLPRKSAYRLCAAGDHGDAVTGGPQWPGSQGAGVPFRRHRWKGKSGGDQRGCSAHLILRRTVVSLARALSWIVGVPAFGRVRANRPDACKAGHTALFPFLNSGYAFVPTVSKGTLTISTAMPMCGSRLPVAPAGSPPARVTPPATPVTPSPTPPR